jgi:hypothetical protein
MERDEKITQMIETTGKAASESLAYASVFYFGEG